MEGEEAGFLEERQHFPDAAKMLFIGKWSLSSPKQSSQRKIESQLPYGSGMRMPLSKSGSENTCTNTHAHTHNLFCNCTEWQNSFLPLKFILLHTAYATFWMARPDDKHSWTEHPSSCPLGARHKEALPTRQGTWWIPKPLTTAGLWRYCA